MNAAPAQPSLADQLRNVVVSPRAELGVSRHVFRSGPAYVLRDPVTFKTHRFDPADYHVLSLIDRSNTLGDTFGDLIEMGLLSPEDEERFYEFVVDLHQRNLLSLPLSDGAVLYKRYERRLRAERASKALGVFFLRVPLVNPDRFLDRTAHLFRWLFTVPALIAWCVLATSAIVVALGRADDLTSPVLTMFSGGNLVMLWAVLIGLKVVHEFGHAYACKVFGGHVPEMGAFLVLFTPLAYVDATDSWSFPHTRRRAAVTLAGVYFESIVGAIALFVWALTGPSTINTIAFQTVLLATVTTALFNLNPLLRYDAYYLVSDLSGIPNLRMRCEQAVATLAKRLILGVRTNAPVGASAHPWPLVCFGLAQLAYRVVIMMTIATVLVMKFGGLGIALACTIIGLTLGKAGASLIRLIATSEELIGRRLRGAATVSAIATAMIAGVLLVPLPWPVHAKGISTFASVQTIHAPSDALVENADLRPGDQAQAGQALLTLASPDLLADRGALEAEHRASLAQATRGALESPSQALASHAQADASLAAFAKTAGDVERLRVTAAQLVHIIAVHERRSGVRVQQGQPLLDVGSGPREAVLLISEQVMDRLTLGPGQEVVCRSPSQPERRVHAIVRSIAPSGTRAIDPQFTQLASAMSIAIDPDTGLASEPLFVIRLTLPGDFAPPANATVVADLPVRPMTTASMLHRQFTLFMNKINQGFSER